MNKREVDKLMQDLDDLRSRLEENGEETIEMARDRADDYVQMAERRAREIADQVKTSGRKVNEYAKEHPWIWMAIGVGVGLTAGLIIGSRTRRD